VIDTSYIEAAHAEGEPPDDTYEDQPYDEAAAEADGHGITGTETCPAASHDGQEASCALYAESEKGSTDTAARRRGRLQTRPDEANELRIEDGVEVAGLDFEEAAFRAVAEKQTGLETSEAMQREVSARDEAARQREVEAMREADAHREEAARRAAEVLREEAGRRAAEALRELAALREAAARRAAEIERELEAARKVAEEREAAVRREAEQLQRELEQRLEAEARAKAEAAMRELEEARHEAEAQRTREAQREEAARVAAQAEREAAARVAAEEAARLAEASRRETEARQEAERRRRDEAARREQDNLEAQTRPQAVDSALAEAERLAAEAQRAIEALREAARRRDGGHAKPSAANALDGVARAPQRRDPAGQSTMASATDSPVPLRAAPAQRGEAASRGETNPSVPPAASEATPSGSAKPRDASGSDKRRHRRVSAQTPASVWNASFTHALPCTIRDKSASGALIEFAAGRFVTEVGSLAIGDRITLTMNASRERTSVECEIVRISGLKCGVRFAGQFRTEVAKPRKNLREPAGEKTEKSPLSKLAKVKGSWGSR
jgi:hypothetical protein